MSEVVTRPEAELTVAADEHSQGLLWLHPTERFVPFGSGKLTLGRDAAASNQLVGERISRVHASIVRDGPLHVLRDEGSRNGTRLNGRPIREVALDEGDVVRMGEWVGTVTTVPRELVRSERFFEELLPGIVLGPKSLELGKRLAKLATTELPVLVQGPTGSGKEVYARALHDLSRRPGRFLAQNCAAIPEALAEAQLFGHARGAFTGALSASPGLFAAADRGTLFLDEIADLPSSQQAKLLRVVEEGSITAVGEVVARAVDVRLVAASHVSLWTRVEQGSFRADLLARLAGATIFIPPIRERREEVLRLFVRFFHEYGGDPSLLESSFVESLLVHDWPLNVREIRLTSQSIAAEHEAGPIGAVHLETALGQHRPRSAAADAARSTSAGASAEGGAQSVLGRRRSAWLGRNGDELRMLRDALEANRGNVSRAAAAVGMSRQRAQRLLTASEEAELGPHGKSRR
jgi:DNA-binding NtrC family response regulator